MRYDPFLLNTRTNSSVGNTGGGHRDLYNPATGGGTIGNNVNPPAGGNES